jgi:hypothetical protein
MKFPKLHLVCSDDDLRPVMSCVCVDKEYTFASDVHILVRHKTSELFTDAFIESLPEGQILIPRKAIFLVCQKMTTEVSLSDDKKLFQIHRKDESIISFKLFTDGTYPNGNSVIPDLKDMKPVDEIGISSNLLDRLSDGLGCERPILRLRFFDKMRAIYVTSIFTDYGSAVGVIMPVIIND